MKDYSSEEFTKLNKNIERIDNETEYINSTLIGKWLKMPYSTSQWGGYGEFKS